MNQNKKFKLLKSKENIHKMKMGQTALFQIINYHQGPSKASIERKFQSQNLKILEKFG